MSTFDYNRFVQLGKRMLTKYGALTTISTTQSVANTDKPWEEGTVISQEYTGLLSAKFDPIKTLGTDGKPLNCDATFYVAVIGLENVTELPQNSVIVQAASPNERWSIIKSELIKPAETGVLWILWVNRYA